MIDRDQVMQAIAEFIWEQSPNFSAENLETLKASDVIKQSLELVEFVLHLEEKLGIEININALGEKLINKDFGGLADELVRMARG
jgi:acyl carrier protein